MTTFRQRVDRLLESLEAMPKGQQWAEETAYSMPHFYRLFQGELGETPFRLRRRLLLERSAELLSSDPASVTEIALESGYNSLEAFSRAFHRAFSVSPSEFRRKKPKFGFLPGPSNIHCWHGAVVHALPGGSQPMNLSDRLIGNDLYLTDQILQASSRLGDKALDTELESPEQSLPFDHQERTLRDVIDRLVFTKEAWLCAIHGRSMPEDTDNTLAGLQRRWESVRRDWNSTLDEIQREGRWNDSFIDALCCPPETFTFGSAVAHVLSFGFVRATTAIRALTALGVKDIGYGDPIGWERSLA